MELRESTARDKSLLHKMRWYCAILTALTFISVLLATQYNIRHGRLISSQLKHIPSIIYHQFAKLNYFGELQQLNLTGVKASYGPKKILFWTDFFGSGWPEYQVGNKYFQRCEIKNCVFSKKQSEVETADALVFHFRDMRDLPQMRHPHQRYIFFLQESPVHTPRSLSKYSNFFNWTFTYRRDSDFLLPYGHIGDMNEDVDNIDYFTGKTKMAAWFVSNCHTSSRRESLVKRLQKIIPVDVYGACGPLKCPRSTTTVCRDNIVHDYKFYLSFENSMCPDYVTEKFFLFIRHRIIVVALGGANYTEMFPGSHLIDVSDFRSVSELATRMKQLGENRDQYNAFFSWRRNYTDHSSVSEGGFCNMCKALNDPSTPRKVYENISHWWNEKMGRCHGPSYQW